MPAGRVDPESPIWRARRNHQGFAYLGIERERRSWPRRRQGGIRRVRPLTSRKGGSDEIDDDCSLNSGEFALPLEKNEYHEQSCGLEEP